MPTKEKKFSVINLSVSKDLKEEFARFAYAIWSNPTSLIKILMKQTIITGQVNLRANPFDPVDWEIEPLDISDWWEDFIKKTEANTRELEKLFA